MSAFNEQDCTGDDIGLRSVKQLGYDTSDTQPLQAEVWTVHCSDTLVSTLILVLDLVSFQLINFSFYSNSVLMAI